MRMRQKLVDSNQEDLQTIESVLQGNQLAYEALVNKYKDYVYTVVYRVLCDAHDAEESTQDTFIKVYRNLSKFNGESKFSTWLYRIAFNTAVTNVRSRKPAAQPLETVNVEAPVTHVSGLELEDRKRYLNRAIAELLPADAALVTLFYMQEQSLQEIAAATGLKANAVKVKLHRARKKLAVVLQKLLHNEAASL